jgi:hypothetical protein
MGTGKDRSKRKAEEKILRTVKQTIATHRMLAAGDSVILFRDSALQHLYASGGFDLRPSTFYGS